MVFIISQYRIGLIGLILLFMLSTQSSAQINDPEKIVQYNLEQYNQRNIETFMACFRNDIELYNFGIKEPVAVGLQAIKSRYTDLFAASPHLHSTILKRMVVGNKVIDHESIRGRMGSSEILELVMIYEVTDGKITRMTSIRK
jgi:hypothetical protein